MDLSLPCRLLNVLLRFLNFAQREFHVAVDVSDVLVGDLSEVSRKSVFGDF